MTLELTRLAPAAMLGPYEILSAVGSGGMAEVYRARDTRLNRTVAIKVLLAHLSENQEIRQRLHREALAISSLNHPNVCALYDMGHQDGVDFLVMEYLEGESLADRLIRGPLPLHQVLKCGIEISEALYWAHQQGIIHRDLKPGNIILTKAGVKLLDFGLAKFVKSLTITSGSKPLTQEGNAFGTPHYMAPEQMEGAPDVDGRVDIFSLGVVLYEMSAGKRPFAGENRSILSELLLVDPDQASKIPALSSPALDRIVRICIAENPEDRWQSARDVALQLKAIAEGATQTGPSRIRDRPSWFKRSRVWIPVTILVLLAAFVIFGIRKPREMPVLKLSILPPDKAALDASGAIALSPDGRLLAIAAKAEQGWNSIWIRAMNSVDPQLLAGTKEGQEPFWSPDNRRLGFFSRGKLQVMKIDGGPPQVLCEASEPYGGSWNRDGVILYSPSSAKEIYQVHADGADPKPVTTLDPARQEISHRWPYFLPDGRHFLYTARSKQRDNNGIFVASLNPGEPQRLLLADDSRVEYAPPGYLLFAREKQLMAQPFDAASLTIKGEAYPVADHVGYDAFTGNALFSASPGRTLLFVAMDGLNTQLVWYDRHGKRLAAVDPPAEYHEPSFSPDQSRVVVTRVDQEAANNDLWIGELESGSFSRFTFNPSNEFTSLWSPDGSQIAFSSNRGSAFGLYRKLANGAGNDVLLLNSNDKILPDDWSADGRTILYEELNPRTRFDLWFLPLSGSRKPQPFLQSDYNETHAQFSPDGKWIAYTSDETGRPEVYLQNSPLRSNTGGSAPTGKWQISTNGGDQVRWRQDNKELYYLSADRKVMAVEIQTDPAFQKGVPAPLFAARVTYNPLGERNQYLASADGQRFLINTPLGENKATAITAFFNWPDSNGASSR